LLDAFDEATVPLETPGEGMRDLTDRQLADFSEAVSWDMAEKLPDGRVLGKVGHAGATIGELDFRLAEVDRRLGLAGKTVLELGSHEGQFTIQLAQRCKQVTAVEVRPKNVVCALIRAFVHDLDNIKIHLKDVREIDASFGRFDILAHLGVLYHLSNPVEHLFQIKDLSDNLLLCTHHGSPALRFQREDIEYAGKTYRAYRYKEFGWQDGWSGMEAWSRWLEKDDLLALLAEIGYQSVEVLREWQPSGYPRITLLAQRSAR
jgi:tRNA (mo5U34)-methyltransferase